MKRPARQRCISGTPITLSSITKCIKAKTLKRVESQARLELDSAPLTQLGQQFKLIMDNILAELKGLYISQSTTRKLENIHRQCTISGSQIINSTNCASSEQFFRNWNILIKECTDYFQLAPLVRSQDFFRSEVTIIRSATRAFLGPKDRMTITSKINTLETQLNKFKLNEKKVPGIEKTISQVLEYFRIFPSSKSRQHMDLVGTAEAKLEKLVASLSEFINNEPTAHSIIEKLSDATEELHDLFETGSAKRKSMTPSKGIPLLQPMQRIQKRHSPKISSLVSKPREANDAELKSRVIMEQIEKQKKAIEELEEKLRASSRKELRDGLTRVYGDYNRQTEEMNSRARVINQCLTELIEMGTESQTVAFSNNQLHNEAQSLLRDISRYTSEHKFLEEQRNNHVFLNQKGEGSELSARELLILENCELMDETRSLMAQIEDERRFVETIQQDKPKRPDPLVMRQIERLKMEIENLEIVSNSLIEEDSPTTIALTDRSVFDENQAIYDRMKEIQAEYHAEEDLPDEKRDALEHEFSRLEDQIPAWEETYEALNDLNVTLNDLREVYASNLDMATVVQKRLIDNIGNKECVEAEVSILLAEAKDPGMIIDEDKIAALKACLREQIETARLLRLADDIITETMPDLRAKFGFE